MQLRLVGVYDGKRYRSYHSIQDFLRGELRPGNDGMWFYAHFGGAADAEFVLQYLLNNPNPNIRVSCSFSGPSAIIIRISNGKYSWYLLDSFWLIRQPLRKIAKWMGGAEKGGAEGSTDIFYGPLSVLKDYNEQDCIILHNAITELENTVLGLGGNLEMTIASTAMGLFRRKYLKQVINTNSDLNDIASSAYIGSRVEVFEKEPPKGQTNYWDINSSFPFSMTFDCPGQLSGTSKTMRDDDNIKIVKANISVRDCDIPPIPYRTNDDKRIYFPTGDWSGWFSGVDIGLLESAGHKINKIEKVLNFEPFTDLKNYAEEIYTLRKNSSHDAEKEMLKILLNSLYGKFAEGELKSKCLINPPPEFFDVPLVTDTNPIGRRYMQPGVWELFEKREINHRHVPIAMHITALSRKWLYQYMTDASTVYYCDTDGFAIPASDELPESKELGGLKKEKPIYEGHFHAPKTYAYRTHAPVPEGHQGPEPPWFIKAKGFSRPLDEQGEKRALSYEDFCHLLEHKELHIEQTLRIKSLLKSGDYQPRDVVRTRTFRDVVNPKRCFPEHGGRSRPWSVAELEDLHLKTPKAG